MYTMVSLFSVVEWMRADEDPVILAACLYEVYNAVMMSNLCMTV